MDQTDFKILRELQHDGHLSNRELADRVALSPSPCLRRVQQLERDGVISRYAALLDRAAVGLQIVAFAHISLDNHHPDTVVEFDKAIAGFPEVLECHATSGDFDYMLKVIVADMDSYEHFLNSELLRVPGVRAVNTSFSLRQKKFTTELPLEKSGEP